MMRSGCGCAGVWAIHDEHPANNATATPSSERRPCRGKKEGEPIEEIQKAK
ncbi:hypothetical protein [Pseudomonas sp. L13]|uniref:hypothetical protein n=1 Tax=Pseudomonas sp. L13 TaxID=343985 RepID=UPI002113F2C1|nr:hypothetical protein [Pseudomonas sp. L13]